VWADVWADVVSQNIMVVSNDTPIRSPVSCRKRYIETYAILYVVIFLGSVILITVGCTNPANACGGNTFSEGDYCIDVCNRSLIYNKTHQLSKQQAFNMEMSGIVSLLCSVVMMCLL